MFKVDSLKESPAVLSLGKLCEENGYSYNDIQPSYLIKNGRKPSAKPTTTFAWWSQECHQPNTRPKLWTTRSRHKLWAFKFDRRISSGRGHTTSSKSSFRASFSKTNFKSWGKHTFFTHFPNDPNCEVCRRTNVAGAPSRINPDDRGG